MSRKNDSVRNMVFTSEDEDDDMDDAYSTIGKKSGIQPVHTEFNRKELKQYEEDLNKLFGPVEKKNKKAMNAKLKKKHKQQKKFEEKKLLTRIGENEEKLFDFIHDFSSSDYEMMSDME